MPSHSDAVRSPFMAKRESAPTKQVNVRLVIPTVRRVDAYRERHPLRPTWTQIIEAALGEWLERNDPPVADPERHHGKLPPPRKASR
jgi:hypothetical protein